MDYTCRLCGCTNATPLDRRPYQKEKFALQIERAFGVNVNEDEDYHPQFVCTSCVRSLRRWWDKAKKKKKATLYIKLAEFSMNDKDTAKTRINWAEVETVAVKHGLAHCVEEGVHMFAALSLSGQATKYVKFREDDWEVYASSVKISKTTQLLKGFEATIIDTTNVLDIITTIANAFVCIGNADLEGNAKEKECQILIPNEGRCFPCRIYRSDIMSLAAKRRKAVAVTGNILASKTRNDYLPQAVAVKKMVKLREQNKCLKRRNETLQDRIDEMVERRHVLAAAVESADDLMQSLNNNPAVVLTERGVPEEQANALASIHVEVVHRTTL